MEQVTKKRLELFSGRAHPELAQEIAGHLGIELGDPDLVDFANTEVRCRFGESIRGADVFIVQSHVAPVNDSIIEQLIMIDAAKRASAKRITAVCAYYGYGRQDRKAEGREPITAKLVADMLTAAGADRIVSVDLHSGQIQGFFDGPFDHLTAMPVLIDHLRAHVPGELVVVSPDIGRAKVAERYARHLGARVAFVDKRRDKKTVNVVEAKTIIGEVAGMTCVLVDDMIDTAGTICAAADALAAAGATDIWAAATHGVLSDPAIDRLKNSVISKVIITNTLPLPEDRRIDKIEVLSIAKVVADAIDAVFEDTSVSEIFGGENQS
ncbi:MAG TPA: ribose-phosphate diphosphokinase [Acidimicrobiales bacterium]|nr:ribose-phosphate diphosphokinase [Acidimicrobiales bacterium]